MTASLRRHYPYQVIRVGHEPLSISAPPAVKLYRSSLYYDRHQLSRLVVNHYTIIFLIINIVINLISKGLRQVDAPVGTVP